MKKIILFLVLICIPINLSFAELIVVGDLARSKIVSPGEKVEGAILLKNNGDKPVRAKAYLTDYLYFADGRNMYGEPGKLKRSNANWITLNPAQITIPAKETTSLYYTLSVPKDSLLKGTYWSMVMVEALPAERVQSIKEEKKKQTLSLQTIIRYGIQISTDIEDSGKPILKIADKKLVSQDGHYLLRLDMENEGDRMLAPSVWLDLYNKEGKNIGRFDSGKMRIYPGCSVRHVFDLTDVPKGSYKGLVVIDGGGQNVFGAQYDFAIN